MYKPFERHIPYYPGEPKHSFPTSETTLFNEIAVVRSADLVARFLSPQTNAKTREGVLRDIFQFCSAPANYEAFHAHVGALLQDVLDKPEEFQDGERIGRYRYLIDKLEERYSPKREASTEKVSPILTEALSIRTKEPALPERSARWRIHPDIIALVNMCLNTIYPYALGNTVKLLREEDIYVSTNRSMDEWLRQTGFHETHSLRLVEGESVRRIFPRAVTEATRAGIWTAHDLPGKPIFYPESGIAMWYGSKAREILPGAREASRIGTTGKILLHENFHRATKGNFRPEDAMVISPDDPLFHLAFASDRFTERGQKNEATREALEAMRHTLEQYAKEHDPHIAISGARVVLLCEDQDVKLRVIASSGYDLEEAIVEALSINGIQPLFDYIRKTHGEENELSVKNHIMKTIGGSSRYQNLFAQAIPYLERLGISGPSNTLEAFSHGLIPHLHAKLLPNEEYHT